MKLLRTTLLLAALTGATPGFAKVEQCRFIDAKPDREACYDRQAKALEAKKAEAAAKQKTTGSLERMKADDEALSRRIKSICRGC
jgi:hypothetical protein